LTLNINPSGTFTNGTGGQVIASGTGTINMAPDGGWTNQGTITINNGTLNLTTDFATAGIGTVTRTGGTVNLTATATTAAAGTFDVQSFGGNVNLLGGRVMGGALTSTGAARLVPNSSNNNRLDGVQVAGNALDLSAGSFLLRLVNGADFSAGAVLTQGGNSALRVEQSGTLNNLNLTLGTAAVPGSAALQLFGGQTVTLASTVTVTAGPGSNNNVGQSGAFGDSGTNNLTNAGTLQANATATTLNINPSGVFTIAPGGTVRASNGGTVNVATANWVNQGTFEVNAGTLNLTADFAAANIGTVSRTGGTIALSATATVAGTLDLQSFAGNLSLQGGRILGGTLTSTGSARLVPNSNAINRLDGVQVAGTALDLSGGSFLLRLVNGADFSAGAILTQGGNSALRVEQSGTLNNLNLTLGTAAVPGSAALQLFGGQTVTLASTVTVTAGPGSNNNVGRSTAFSDSGTNALTNQGTLQATAANTTLNINPSGLFTNQGTILASGGGTVNFVPTTWANTGTVTAGLVPGDGSRITGPVFVDSGGVLQGVGAVNGPVTVNSGGTLHPGTSPGILTVTGPINLASGAHFAVDINGPAAGAFSQLVLSGAGSINLAGATLDLSLGYAPAANDSYTIITGGPVNGEFNGLPNGQPVTIGTFGGTDYTRFIMYSPSSVTLSPVQEPAFVLLAGMAAAGCWRARSPRPRLSRKA
jgi:hypothetical protein